MIHVLGSRGTCKIPENVESVQTEIKEKEAPGGDLKDLAIPYIPARGEKM